MQRLTFLHEHGISGLSLSDPSSYMVDISSCPTTPGESTSFDRFKYPVHYYFVNFSKATRLPRQLLYVTPTPVSSTFEKSSSLAQDVRDCGVMLAKLIEDVRAFCFPYLGLGAVLTRDLSRFLRFPRPLRRYSNK